MGWPTSQEYNHAIQSPAAHFAEADLCHGQAVPDARGFPWLHSGRFADIYRLRCPGGDFAVKCFTREVPGLWQRYAAISAHLRQFGFPFTVDFQFLDPGVRVGNAWYPVVKMRWAEGQPLNAFVRDNLDKPEVLQELLATWVGMAGRLRAAGIAHGDLQHRNVLCLCGDALQVRLIGYEGMYVPALAGTLTAEVGHPNYQHPQRLREGTFGPEVDRFPLLVVAAALCGLRVAGRWLWEHNDGGDNLLFRQVDFAAPGQSRLFAELLSFPDAEARTAAGRLMAAALQPLNLVPLLEEVFPNCHPARLPAETPPAAADPTRWAPAAEPAPPELPDYGQVAPHEHLATSYQWHPDYGGNLRRKAIGALVLSGALLLVSAVGGLVYWRTRAATLTDATQAMVPGVVAEPQGGQPQDETVPAPPADGKKVNGQKSRPLTPAELWAKKRDIPPDKVVTVVGRITQEGTINDLLRRMWKVQPDVWFVGLGDNGKGRAQVFCVFPGRRVPSVVGVGRNCRLEGTYRGTVKNGDDDVPLVVDCKLVQGL